MVSETKWLWGREREVDDTNSTHDESKKHEKRRVDLARKGLGERDLWERDHVCSCGKFQPGYRAKISAPVRDSGYMETGRLEGHFWV